MRVGINALFLIPSEVGGSEIYLMELLTALVAKFPSLELVVFTNIENHEMFTQHFGSKPQVSFVPL